MGLGGKDANQVEVTDYFMSVHFGLCHGPLDSISRIIVKEKEAWSGYATGNTPVSVSAKDLFGGNKKEGGVSGVAHLLPGGLDQRFPAYLAARFRRTPDTMPSYRGIATVFFTDGNGAGAGSLYGGNVKGGASRPYANQGGKGADAAIPYPDPGTGTPLELTGNESYSFQDIPLDRSGGFYWASNNPYLPDTWITATRVPQSALAADLNRIENLVPEALIGPVETPEENEDDDPDNDIVPNANREDPLNSYYIGALPDAETFAKTQYGYKSTYAGLALPAISRAGGYASAVGAGRFAALNLTGPEKTRYGADGIVYRNYGQDANPAGQILEALTNEIWGMGAPVSMVDIPSFTAAAITLRNEAFGLSMLWAEQATIENWVTEILDHIQGMLFISPRTGLFKLKLIRDDYGDPSTLREVNTDNADLKSFQRKAWGDTINEIVLTWTNPENEKESTITLQDLANISIQGGIVSDSRNYYGIRNASLGARVCARDLRTASAPTASLEASLDRSAWDIEPGEVITVKWDEEGIDGAVYRIMDVDYGKVGQSAVQVKFVEDIFSLPTQGYTVPSVPRPTPRVSLPTPLDFITTMTVPYQIASRYGATQDGANYPNVGVLFLGATRNASVESFTLVTESPLPTGEIVDVSAGNSRVTTHIRLAAVLPKEFTSTVSIFSDRTRDGGLPAQGGILIIGDSDTDSEICLFSGYDEEDGYSLQRGILDTVPRDWPVDTGAWVIEFAVFNGVDGVTRSSGVPVDYRIVTRTAEAELDLEDAQEWTYTPGDRPYCPTRPANCRVDGQPLLRKYTTRPASPVPVTWANRNRTMEDTIFPLWQEPNITPEAGQTTTIRVLNESGDVEQEQTGLTGTSATIDTTGLTGGAMRVQFFAERDDFESIQAFEVILDIPFEPGYGYGYGGKYGD